MHHLVLSESICGFIVYIMSNIYLCCQWFVYIVLNYTDFYVYFFASVYYIITHQGSIDIHVPND